MTEEETKTGAIEKITNGRFNKPFWNLYCTSMIAFHFKVIVALWSGKDLQEKIDYMYEYSTEKMYIFSEGLIERNYICEVLFILFAPLLFGFAFYFIMVGLEILTMKWFLKVKKKINEINSDFPLVEENIKLKKENNDLIKEQQKLKDESQAIRELRNKIVHSEKDVDGEDVVFKLDEILDEKDTSNTEHLMVVFPCNESFDVNIKHKLYYHPAERKIREGTKYIGIYANKKITHIGKIKIELEYSQKDGSMYNKYYEEEAREISKLQLFDILENAIKDSPHKDLKEIPYRYYLFSEMYEVNLVKKSKGALWGRKYFDLAKDFKELEDYMSFEEICAIIKGSEYE